MMNRKSKNKDKQQLPASSSDALFERVVSVLEQARSKVVQAVNSEMIIAYWLIGRKIVQEIQRGEERAEYGKKIIKDLPVRLNKKYGKGFSTTNLWYYRQFYIVYSNRKPEIRHKACGESGVGEKLHKACGVLDDLSLAVEKSDSIQGFSYILSWSHYRALTKVENKNEAIARYSVLNNSKQLFASKYMLYLPTEKELEEELKRERRRIEEKQSLDDGDAPNDHQLS